MTRQKLPSRRGALVINLMHWGQPLTATIGFYEDGRPSELFLDPPKYSNDFANLARDAALVISLALQHGITVEEMRDGVGRTEAGVPHSVLGTALDALAEGMTIK
jgi:hypothetical protein